MSLSDHVAGFLVRHGLEHSTGVIAVSGGPDSVALAHLLAKSGKLERLIIGHVNHQLRGAESDAEEAFVQALAAERGLSCQTTRIGTAAIAAAEHDNLESIARRERYQWLTDLAHRGRASWIAVGHSADDQAETVLFRLLRGSGLLGLAGMRACRPHDGQTQLVRPLLSVRRQEILEYLENEKIPYRVDSSNRDRQFTRNRIRLDLLPLLQKDYNGGIVNVLCRLAEQARELHAENEAKARQLLTEAELPRAGDLLVFSIALLHQASSNLVREMFRLVWQREQWPMGDMDFERWDMLCKIVAGAESARDFPGEIHARRVANVLQLQKRPAKSS